MYFSLVTNQSYGILPCMHPFMLPLMPMTDLCQYFTLEALFQKKKKKKKTSDVRLILMSCRRPSRDNNIIQVDTDKIPWRRKEKKRKSVNYLAASECTTSEYAYV